jgi:hypothetical protein
MLAWARKYLKAPPVLNGECFLISYDLADTKDHFHPDRLA